MGIVYKDMQRVRVQVRQVIRKEPLQGPFHDFGGNGMAGKGIGLELKTAANPIGGHIHKQRKGLIEEEEG